MSEFGVPRKPDPEHGEHVEEDPVDTDVDEAAEHRDDRELDPEPIARLLPPD